MKGQAAVLCIRDGTDPHFAEHPGCAGLGLSGENQRSKGTLGLHMHSMLAVNGEGILVGVPHISLRPLSALRQSSASQTARCGAGAAPARQSARGSGPGRLRESRGRNSAADAPLTDRGRSTSRSKARTGCRCHHTWISNATHTLTPYCEPRNSAGFGSAITSRAGSPRAASHWHVARRRGRRIRRTCSLTSSGHASELGDREPATAGCPRIAECAAGIVAFSS